jgi:hypothetical protein
MIAPCGCEQRHSGGRVEIRQPYGQGNISIQVFSIPPEQVQAKSVFFFVIISRRCVCRFPYERDNSVFTMRKEAARGGQSF